MRWISRAVLAGVLATGTLLAQGWGRGRGGGCGGGGDCWASGFPASSATELHGHVAAVQLTPGMGMPSVTVQTGEEQKVVSLGSMRYLMMQGFNPKVGEEVAIKAFQANGRYFAASVTLPAQNKTIELRDASGRPLWRRGPRW